MASPSAGTSPSAAPVAAEASHTRHRPAPRAVARFVRATALAARPRRPSSLAAEASQRLSSTLRPIGILPVDTAFTTRWGVGLLGRLRSLRAPHPANAARGAGHAAPPARRAPRWSCGTRPAWRFHPLAAPPVHAARPSPRTLVPTAASRIAAQPRRAASWPRGVIASAGAGPRCAGSPLGACPLGRQNGYFPQFRSIVGVGCPAPARPARAAGLGSHARQGQAATRAQARLDPRAPCWSSVGWPDRSNSNRNNNRKGKGVRLRRTPIVSHWPALSTFFWTGLRTAVKMR